ncbi:hypothetical protein KFK09_001044 [Dendrobium nobile]|uniref:Uncharacterized protein n=1 Tax=Dendrobium nobile TaxID=94219 RepID=A0A8T3CAA2_DENNO|nr:hypothetical protein KFK09_001044 [Dendrobium nobile]
MQNFELEKPGPDSNCVPYLFFCWWCSEFFGMMMTGTGLLPLGWPSAPASSSPCGSTHSYGM